MKKPFFTLLFMVIAAIFTFGQQKMTPSIATHDLAIGESKAIIVDDTIYKIDATTGSVSEEVIAVEIFVEKRKRPKVLKTLSLVIPPEIREYYSDPEGDHYRNSDWVVRRLLSGESIMILRPNLLYPDGKSFVCKNGLVVEGGFWKRVEFWGFYVFYITFPSLGFVLIAFIVKLRVRKWRNPFHIRVVVGASYLIPVVGFLILLNGIVVLNLLTAFIVIFVLFLLLRRVGKQKESAVEDDEDERNFEVVGD